MLNMNFRDYELRNFEILQIMHFMFVCIIAVLLINFLIAVMSNSVAEVDAQKYLVHRLERLQILLTTEFRTRWILKCYHGYIARRLGIMRNNRVLLSDVVWNPQFD